MGTGGPTCAITPTIVPMANATAAEIAELLEQPTLSIAEAARVLGISSDLCYDLARRGEIPVIRLGTKKMRVPTHKLKAMLGIPERGATPAPLQTPIIS